MTLSTIFKLVTLISNINNPSCCTNHLCVSVLKNILEFYWEKIIIILRKIILLKKKKDNSVEKKGIIQLREKKNSVQLWKPTTFFSCLDLIRKSKRGLGSRWKQYWLKYSKETIMLGKINDLVSSDWIQISGSQLIIWIRVSTRFYWNRGRICVETFTEIFL